MKKSPRDLRKELFPYLETRTFDSPPEIRIKFDVRFLPSAEKFLLSLNEKHRGKIIYNIERAQVNTDPKIFKKLNKDLWEFRANCTGIQYRFLSFWYDGDHRTPLVLVTHGFIKKVSKISTSELNRAAQIRQQYHKSLKDQL